MTERLYYTDCYLREFSARIVDRSEDGLAVYLDRTAFYPASGGQPSDTGAIAGVPVVEVADEGERIVHRLAAPLHAGPVDCTVDWERRFDHMQQHTGQHLLSAVFAEALGLKTVSFHLGAESSTIDLEGGAVEPRGIQEVEGRANEIVFEDRPVAVRFENAAEAQRLRKPSDREGVLRIVSIEGIDRSACGGTHVRSTGEIGAVLLRKLDRVRQTTRVEFLCGGRAVRRARADYDALSNTAQLLSAALDEVPAYVAANLETARTGEKARRKLELELAGYRGKELWETTEPGPGGMRRVVRRAKSGNLEELRALAQNFTAQSKAVFMAVLEDPPALLLAASEDSGIDAGRTVKAAVTAAGGRGGGNARIAQGSVAGAEALETVLAAITAAIS
jgi:alanyl-tRNA synthetase